MQHNALLSGKIYTAVKNFTAGRDKFQLWSDIETLLLSLGPHQACCKYHTKIIKTPIEIRDGGTKACARPRENLTANIEVVALS